MGEFRFCSSIKLTEITGRSAGTLDELLQGIRELDGSVIFHHTHHFVLRFEHLVPEPHNDFALWAETALQDPELAERLGGVDTVEFGTIRELRTRIEEVIERHGNGLTRSRRVPDELRFHFQRTRSLVMETPLVARDLRSFADAVARVSVNSLYHHMFEARLRLERGPNDFSAWLGGSLGEGKLAEDIARLDPYASTLEELRFSILDLLNRRLEETAP